MIIKLIISFASVLTELLIAKVVAMLVLPNRLKPKTTTFCGFAKHFLNAIVILIILLREILSTGKESVNVNFVMMHTRRPRGGQLGREELRRKFSRTVERAPGMLLLKNQFHDSF